MPGEHLRDALLQEQGIGSVLNSTGSRVRQTPGNTVRPLATQL